MAVVPGLDDTGDEGAMRRLKVSRILQAIMLPPGRSIILGAAGIATANWPPCGTSSCSGLKSGNLPRFNICPAPLSRQAGTTATKSRIKGRCRSVRPQP